jgi:ABC-type transport system involved in multi-copper enzyme maturation permease subunit
MITHIIKKEIVENTTSYRFLILTGLLCLLMVVSIIVSYGDFQLRLENYNILRPDRTSPDIIIPPNPVSIFAKGLDANMGRLYEISFLGVQVHMSQQSVNRLFSLFAVPDMLFIIKVMLALIAILFSFDVITDEKEKGTLKLTLANGSQRASLLFGKLLGRFVLVFVPFLLLFYAAAIVV